VKNVNWTEPVHTMVKWLFVNTMMSRFEVFIVVKIQVKVFWPVTLCSIAVDGGRKVLQNTGILP